MIYQDYRASRDEGSPTCYELAAWEARNPEIQVMMKDRFLTRTECRRISEIYAEIEEAAAAEKKAKAIQKYEDTLSGATDER